MKKLNKIIIASNNNLFSSILNDEEVKLKACHKTEEQKEQEKLELLKQKVSEDMIEEYKLIKLKKSKLSRARREYIISIVENYL